MGTFFKTPDGRFIKELETIVDDWPWRKREPEELSKLVLVLPEILQRLDAIETHLEQATKKADGKTPFVRASQRFSTDMVDTTEVLNQLNTRLEAVEKVVASK